MVPDNTRKGSHASIAAIGLGRTGCDHDRKLSHRILLGVDEKV